MLRITDADDGTRVAGLAGLQSCGSPWAARCAPAGSVPNVPVRFGGLCRP